MEQTKKNRGEFLYNVGDIIDKKLLLDRFKQNGKLYYRYRCLIDNNIDNILEYNLQHGQGCNVCSNQKVLKGINDIATTDKESISIFENINDCYTHSRGSGRKVWMICPNCGNRIYKQIYLYFINKNLNCVCNDRISCGEKMIFSILSQLNISFDYHKRDFTWNKNYNKEYDFYISSLNCIIEVNGKQHYTESFKYDSSRTLQEEQENDELKESLAKENKVISYIKINASKSNLDYIKNSIINNDELNNIIDLGGVDWDICYKFASSTRVKEACDYWNKGVYSTVSIAELMKLNKNTIQKYLNIGTKLKWCEYIPLQIRKNNGLKNVKRATDKIKKQVMCVNNGMIFESIIDAMNQSENCLGIHINRKYISLICNNKRNNYKGFKFTFI